VQTKTAAISFRESMKSSAERQVQLSGTFGVVGAWSQQFGVGTVEVDAPATLFMFLTSQTHSIRWLTTNSLLS